MGGQPQKEMNSGVKSPPVSILPLGKSLEWTRVLQLPASSFSMPVRNCGISCRASMHLPISQMRNRLGDTGSLASGSWGQGEP